MGKSEVINGVKVKLRRLHEKSSSGKQIGRRRMPEEKRKRVYKTQNKVEKNPRQRKNVVLDDRLRRSLMGLAKMGLTNDEIADTIGISKRWLQEHFKHELQFGRQLANALVVENLYQQAMKDQPSSIQAGIYITKARMGWRDKDPDEVQRAPSIVFDFSNLPETERLKMLQKLAPKSKDQQFIEAEYEHISDE
jgi:hypothetical protein